MCMNLIGTGVVFHAPSFFKELAELEGAPAHPCVGPLPDHL
jgi:adenylosuccinate synthase